MASTDLGPYGTRQPGRRPALPAATKERDRVIADALSAMVEPAPVVPITRVAQWNPPRPNFRLPPTPQRPR
jgi:hypothetical protein